MKITRFAPSPTGPLHLGHAYAALVAQARGDRMLLRIEDIDQSRSRQHWEDAIHIDLEWLGITYPLPVMRQSERQPHYEAALDDLWSRELLYPCTCRRKDIESAASAPQEGAPMFGPDGIVYPGTCRAMSSRSGARPHGVALRLDMKKVADQLSKSKLTFIETAFDPHKGLVTVDMEDMIKRVGDVVLARKDMGTSYHLSVVLDDASQGITEVTRGYDLFDATKIHVALQYIMSLPSPDYHHHSLIRDADGKRLAKRDDARSLSLFREAGWQAADLKRRLLGNPAQIISAHPMG